MRVNGGPWISTPWPPGGTFGWRTIDTPIPLTHVREGTNTIELRYTADDAMVVSNINLILIAGAPAPAPVPYG